MEITIVRIIDVIMALLDIFVYILFIKMTELMTCSNCPVFRELAEECQVPWKEYWPFLKDFADFRSDEGLMKFEKYLEQRFENEYKNQNYTMRPVNSAMV